MRNTKKILNRPAQVAAPFNVPPTKQATITPQTFINDRDKALLAERLLQNEGTDIERSLHYFNAAVNHNHFTPEQFWAAIQSSNMVHCIDLVDEMKNCFKWAMDTLTAADAADMLDTDTLTNIYNSHYQRFNFYAALLQQSKLS